MGDGGRGTGDGGRGGAPSTSPAFRLEGVSAAVGAPIASVGVKIPAGERSDGSNGVRHSGRRFERGSGVVTALLSKKKEKCNHCCVSVSIEKKT